MQIRVRKLRCNVNLFCEVVLNKSGASMIAGLEYFFIENEKASRKSGLMNFLLRM